MTPWTAAHQASLSFPATRSLLKLMSIESVMPSNHLILCCPLPSPPALSLCQYQWVGHTAHSGFLYHLPGQPDSRFHSCVHIITIHSFSLQDSFSRRALLCCHGPCQELKEDKFQWSSVNSPSVTFVPLPVHFPLKFGWKSLNIELFKDPVCSFESKDL